VKKLNLIFLAAMAGLIIIGLGTLAICIWILESWWARVGLCLGVGCFLMMVFYGAVFWLAALANRIDRQNSE
jgi:hypothetical protein